MPAPFDPLAVAERWLFATLSAVAALDAEIGTDNLWPRLSPPTVAGRHVTHGFAGPPGGTRAEPLGGGLSQIALRWHVTVWEPGFSLQAVEAAVLAVMTELLGPDMRGRLFRFADGGRTFEIEARWLGPQQAAVDTTGAQIWSPRTDWYSLAIRAL